MEKERSYLGASLSLEFSDCSIAAAEANEDVRKITSGQTNMKSLFKSFLIAGDSIEEQMTQCFPLGHYLDRPNNVSTVIIQPLREVSQPSTGILGRVVQIIKKPDFAAVDDPILAAVIDNRVAVPIATFARRDHGNCDYVQLGSEMRDEDFFTIRSDEYTSRQEYIEAIRALTGSSNTKPFDEAIGSLGDLYEIEANRKPEQLIDAKQILLTERCLEVFRSNKVKQRNMCIMRDGDSSLRQNISCIDLTDSFVTEDGRETKLVLGRSATNASQKPDLEIFAVTRGDLALQIAKIPTDNSRIDFHHEEKITIAQKEALIDILLQRLRLQGTTHEEYGGLPRIGMDHNAAHEKKQTVRALASLGLTSTWHSLLDLPKDEVVHEKVKYITRTRDAHVRDASLREAVRYLHVRDEKLRLLTQGFGIDDKMAEMLGSTCSEYENFVEQVAQAYTLSKTYRAVFHEIKIGATAASADIKIVIGREGERYNFEVFGRPNSMPDESHTKLMGVSFDKTQPVFQDKESFEKIKELADLLRRIRQFPVEAN